MNRMVLGTVQLGMPYGVNNRHGKPQRKEAIQMLEYAYQNGIRCLDTARAYGDSEAMIGEYMEQSGNIFEICTKLPALTDETQVINCYEQSRKTLKTDIFCVYYIHRFEGFKSIEVLKQLALMKEKGMIQAVGVSIYEPAELNYILEHMSDMVDVVQLPFNLLDNERWLKQGLLAKAREKGVNIYVRSVYLQGLLLMDRDTELWKAKNVERQMMELQDIAQNLGYSMAQLAVNFCNTMEEIERYLVGCETERQICENIIINQQIKKVPVDICERIQKISSSVTEQVIDPRKWGG